MGFQSSGDFPGGQTAQDNLLSSVAASLVLGNMRGTGGFGDIPPQSGFQSINQSLGAALGRPFIQPASLPLTGQPAASQFSGQPAAPAFQNAAPQAGFQRQGLTPMPDFNELFGRIRFPTQAEIRRKRF